ncbi:DUF1353 domain-containing protein [Microcella alkaliphila]|uniref:Ketol-acid reductoisomerase n=1 Tax=Microcella alkaliphila TaxID=279828 RepID=A0A0U5BND9_9MICO|nr:DUF1353 domain-containing protein [Microcella alkaliphila]BAU33045.1 ketol-acid reductoisomerase [Microcella alkaliphila]
MPFETLDGRPLDRLALVYRRGRDFQVVEPFQYRERASGAVTRIPAHDLTLPPGPGNSTDFASVPPFLWGLIANYGPQTLPAVMHDAEVAAAVAAPAPERLALRRAADERFRLALIDEGVHLLRARTMWAAVGLESWWRHGGLAGRVLIAQVALGTLALTAMVPLAVLLSPWWMLVAVAPAALAPLWRRDVALVIAASYLGALYLPLALGAYAAAHVENAIAMVVWLVTGRRGPRPSAEPNPAWRDEYRRERPAPR